MFCVGLMTCIKQKKINLSRPVSVSMFFYVTVILIRFKKLGFVSGKDAYIMAWTAISTQSRFLNVWKTSYKLSCGKPKYTQWRNEGERWTYGLARFYMWIVYIWDPFIGTTTVRSLVDAEEGAGVEGDDLLAPRSMFTGLTVNPKQQTQT